MHIKNDNNLRVVKLGFSPFSWLHSIALLKAVCSPLKKILAVNIRNLLLGMRLQCPWSKENASLQCYGHLIRKVCLLWQHNFRCSGASIVPQIMLA